MELTRIPYPVARVKAVEPAGISGRVGDASFWSRRWTSSSIATRVAVILSLAIGAIFAVAAAVTYRDTKSQTLADALGKLDSYNQEVVAE
jgi:hypothetical protein